MSSIHYYGHGKLLITGEYFVVDGARALAVPTKLGQSMRVTLRQARHPKLFWKSFDDQDQTWFEASFELWHFDVLETNDPEKSQLLKEVFTLARELNIHFLRDDFEVHVETKLEFPLHWGLGSSSTLVYLISQWAYVSPFELAKGIQNGSGYDVACAQSDGPIVYELKDDAQTPSWTSVDFAPYFKDQLYFVGLNQKQITMQSLQHYHSLGLSSKDDLIERINALTDEALISLDLKNFEQVLFEHEKLLSSTLKLERVKAQNFPDFWGEVKSLGAWGGDFVLATSNRSTEETMNYFKNRGFQVIFNYDDLILNNRPHPPEMLSIQKKILTKEFHGTTWF